MNNKTKITVLIPTYNVASIIEQCIESAKWADEILVVDSFSTDNTLEIAEKMGARILQHEYIYSAKQKNWSIPQAKHNWVLLLDSDEVITEELKNEILRLAKSGEIEKYDGFGIARQHIFLGKFLRWGGRYPLYNIRLFRKTCRYEDRDVHAHIVLHKDRVKLLKGDIIHYSDPTLDHFFRKFNRYTTYQANYMMKFLHSENKKIEWNKFFNHYIYAKSIIKDYWYFLPFVPFLRFFYMYIVRFGFLDGKMGFLIAVLYSFQDYVSKTKYLELRGRYPGFRILAQKLIINFLPKGNKHYIADRIVKEELAKI